MIAFKWIELLLAYVAYTLALIQWSDMLCSLVPQYVTLAVIVALIVLCESVIIWRSRMEIKTKFDIGDRVFLFNSSKTGENAERGEIMRINIKIVGKKLPVEIEYSVRPDGVSSNWVDVKESDLFLTKDELVKKILKRFK